MWKPFFTRSIRNFYTYAWLSLFMLSFTTAIQASETLTRDFQQPVHIEADREFLDLKNHLFQVQGQVIVTQGSLKIQADELFIEGFGQTPENDQRLIASGQPATYTQEVEVDIFVTAHAKKITYDTLTRILVLEGEAEFIQQDNFLKAARITYDLEAQTIVAERSYGADGAAGIAGTENETQRVRVSLMPQNIEKEGQKEKEPSSQEQP